MWAAAATTTTPEPVRLPTGHRRLTVAQIVTGCVPVDSWAVSGAEERVQEVNGAAFV